LPPSLVARVWEKSESQAGGCIDTHNRAVILTLYAVFHPNVCAKSRLLSVYADMSTTCRESRNDSRSMLEFVFAPASIATGADRDWIGCCDEEIVAAVMEELERLFPQNFGACASSRAVSLVKSSVVKTPQSIYLMAPGMQRHRPLQTTPVANFFLAGDWTSQMYLASMEGAILSGKQAAEAVVAKDQGREPRVVSVEPASIPASIDVTAIS